MKNEKAISPVLAVLLMIAVAVAAALITYAWVMTYLESTTSRAGHAMQIQSVAFTSTTATVYAQNVGDGTIIISDAYFDGALVSVSLTEVPPVSGDADGTTLEGTTTTVLYTRSVGTFDSGDEVLIKVVCSDGTFTSGTYTVP